MTIRLADQVYALDYESEPDGVCRCRWEYLTPDCPECGEPWTEPRVGYSEPFGALSVTCPCGGAVPVE